MLDEIIEVHGKAPRIFIEEYGDLLNFVNFAEKHITEEDLGYGKNIR